MHRQPDIGRPEVVCALPAPRGIVSDVLGGHRVSLASRHAESHSRSGICGDGITHLPTSRRNPRCPAQTALPVPSVALFARRLFHFALRSGIEQIALSPSSTAARIQRSLTPPSLACSYGHSRSMVPQALPCPHAPDSELVRSTQSKNLPPRRRPTQGWPRVGLPL